MADRARRINPETNESTIVFAKNTSITYLNGYRIDKPEFMEDKDIVSFGDIEFLFVKGEKKYE